MTLSRGMLARPYRIAVVCAALATQFPGCASTKPQRAAYAITADTDESVLQPGGRVSQESFDQKVAELSAKTSHFLTGDSASAAIQQRTDDLFRQQAQYSKRYNKRSRIGGLVGLGIAVAGSIAVMGAVLGTGRDEDPIGGLGSAVAGCAVLLTTVFTVPVAIATGSLVARGRQVPPLHSRQLSSLIDEYNHVVQVRPQPAAAADSLNK